ncbi:receptor-type tyrosine-protein phosphatase V-like [Arapaima gigas]
MLPSPPPPSMPPPPSPAAKCSRHDTSSAAQPSRETSHQPVSMTACQPSPGCDHHILAAAQGTLGGPLACSTMGERPSSLAQLLRDFQLQCQSLATKNNAGYRLEFERLSEVGRELSTRAGDLGVNREKNRYLHILPYDHCRVKLTPQDSDVHSDYINANYIPVSPDPTTFSSLLRCLSLTAVPPIPLQGGVSERDFICTQGPLSNTLADFWHMVWEQNVHVIVMLTNCKQNNKVLCEQYWPQDCTSLCYGRYQVTSVRRRHGPGCLITTLRLRQMDAPTERKVTHYYYPGWPDRGVPWDFASFCSFAEHVRQQLDSAPRVCPAVIHCSAGVGRSGTFVALLWLMQLCARGTWPDVRGVVYNLRMHRVMMVQALEQYIFVHSCLLHWMSEQTRYKPRSVKSSRRTDRTRDPHPPTPEAPPLWSWNWREDRQKQEQLRHRVAPPILAPTGIQRLFSVTHLQRFQTLIPPGLGWGVEWSRTLPPQTKQGCLVFLQGNRGIIRPSRRLLLLFGQFLRSGEHSHSTRLPRTDTCCELKVSEDEAQQQHYSQHDLLARLVSTSSVQLSSVTPRLGRQYNSSQS